MKIIRRDTIFAVAIMVMIVMALTMNFAAAEPPAKGKVNQRQHKADLNHSEPHRAVSNPSETISSPSSVTRSSWCIETVDSTGISPPYISIALDSYGYPHISYYDGTNDALKYAKWTGMEWNIEALDYSGRGFSGTSIALNSSGYPHISYGDYDPRNLELKYAYQTEAAAGDDIVAYRNGWWDVSNAAHTCTDWTKSFVYGIAGDKPIIGDI